MACLHEYHLHLLEFTSVATVVIENSESNSFQERDYDAGAF